MTHETNPIPGFCSLSKNWWAFVLRGVLALVISVLAWFMPAEAVLTLTLVFGAFAFADGVFGLIAAVRQMREGERWGWLAFSGILGILTGIVVIVSPFVATLVLAVFLWASIAFWSVFSGPARDRHCDPSAQGDRGRGLARAERHRVGPAGRPDRLVPGNKPR